MYPFTKPPFVNSRLWARRSYDTVEDARRGHGLGLGVLFFAASTASFQKLNLEKWAQPLTQGIPSGPKQIPPIHKTEEEILCVNILA